jgi:GxxExxY protein
LIEAETTCQVIGAYYEVFNELGIGFLEHVYENALVIALRQRGVRVCQQEPIEIRFRGLPVGDHRADVLVPGKVLIEIKAVQALGPAHDAQLLNYLKATGIPVGLLLNFGPRPEIRRRIAADRLFGSDPRKSVVETDVQ